MNLLPWDNSRLLSFLYVLADAGTKEIIAPLTERIFAHSTPALYDRYMGFLFEPYAKFVAERCAHLQPDQILETAAGTGIVTRAVHRAAPRAQVVATDINPAMLEFAAHAVTTEQVTFKPADAQKLPFSDGIFDLAPTKKHVGCFAPTVTTC
jgi:2-polyprenyl-3-methyl-5-hydroxy-6-metoxy-1,4-benzoquinol methylase